MKLRKECDLYGILDGGNAINFRMKTRKKNFFNREDVIAFNIDDDCTHFLVFQLISLAKNSSELIIN